MNYFIKFTCCLIIAALYGLSNYHLISNYLQKQKKYVYIYKILVGFYLISFSFELFPFINNQVNQNLLFFGIFVLILNYSIFEITQLLATNNFINRNDNKKESSEISEQLKLIKHYIFSARIIIIILFIIFIYIFWNMSYQKYTLIN